MTFTTAIERLTPRPVIRLVDRGQRAQAIMHELREQRGMHDKIHGWIRDERPLPAAWALGLSLVLRPVERTLQRFMEHTLPEKTEAMFQARINEARLEREKVLHQYRLGMSDGSGHFR